jgi:hypothetical protein
MKDKLFIFYGNPCSTALAHPEIQSFDDAERHPVVECPYAADPSRCSPPRFGCVRVAGARMARAAIHFHTETSERTLALRRDLFRLEGPLVGTAVEAYIDPDRGFKHITEPEEVVQRVWEHARAVLGLKPGERVRLPVGR